MVGVFALEADDLRVDHLGTLLLVDVLDEILKALLVQERHGLRLGLLRGVGASLGGARRIVDAIVFVDILVEIVEIRKIIVNGILDRAVIGERDLEALVEEGHLLETLTQRLELVLGGLENVTVGPERHARAGLGGFLTLFERGVRHAVRVLLAPHVTVTLNFDLEALRKRVHDGRAHAVQTARDRVAAATELAARVEHRQHELNGGLLLGGVHRHGNTATIVDHAHAAVLEDVHGDLTRVARERLINRVVDDFVHEVVQAALASRTDVHAWAFTNRLEAFEDGDVRGVVMRCVFLGFAHEGISLMVNAGSVEPGCEDRGPVNHDDPCVGDQAHRGGPWPLRAVCGPLSESRPLSTLKFYRTASVKVRSCVQIEVACVGRHNPSPLELHRGCGGLGDRQLRIA